MRMRIGVSLSDDRIIEVVKDIATANGVGFVGVELEPVMASGLDAIEVRIVIPEGSADSIPGEPSARTVSQIIQRLADAGEERVLIVRYSTAQMTDTMSRAV